MRVDDESKHAIQLQLKWTLTVIGLVLAACIKRARQETKTIVSEPIANAKALDNTKGQQNTIHLSESVLYYDSTIDPL